VWGGRRACASKAGQARPGGERKVWEKAREWQRVVHKELPAQDYGAMRLQVCLNLLLPLTCCP